MAVIQSVLNQNAAAPSGVWLCGLIFDAYSLASKSHDEIEIIRCKADLPLA